jgi:hypothetical protein
MKKTKSAILYSYDDPIRSAYQAKYVTKTLTRFAVAIRGIHRLKNRGITHERREEEAYIDMEGDMGTDRFSARTPWATG